MSWTSEDVAKKMQENKDLAGVNGLTSLPVTSKEITDRPIQARKAMEQTSHETEADFASWVIDYARLKGWRVAHFRPARTIKNGEVTWRTAVSADGAGFPDLVMVRGGRLLFVELKSAKGKLSPEQENWIESLGWTVTVCYIWRPSDRDRIMVLLESPQAGQAEKV